MRPRFLGKRIKMLFACNDDEIHQQNPESSDLREEYANAFRTESYNDFWMHVLALNSDHLTTQQSLESSTAARLPSYRLFAENLLDPDQPTVIRILSSIRTKPKILTLLRDYFANTSDASHLCGLLLKDIDHVRKRYKALKQPFDPNNSCSTRTHLPAVLSQVTLFSQSNPFSPSSPSMSHFQDVHRNCSSLLKQLEAKRHKTQAKARRLKKLKCGSAVLITALTASFVAIVVVHPLVLLVAGPGVATAWLELIGIEKLDRWTAQLDAAAKGTYILIRDLDTVSRLVARLNNEMEHVEAWVQLWVKRDDHWLQADGEVVAQLKKNDERFVEELDELEEHLYLCFMTINRARNLVIKEIMNSRTQLEFIKSVSQIEEIRT